MLGHAYLTNVMHNSSPVELLRLLFGKLQVFCNAIT